jgi:cholestenol delta-isomerase
MVHHNHMASAQDLFGQLWKEYALSDSRYMTSDTLVLCMETMTVVSPTTIYKTNRIHR